MQINETWLVLKMKLPTNYSLRNHTFYVALSNIQGLICYKTQPNQHVIKK